MNIFTKATNNLNLTPGQRAFLKLFKGWLYTALGVGIIAGAQYLTSTQVDWTLLLRASGGAALLSLLLALEKYFTSQGDAPLAVATAAVETKVEQILPPQGGSVIAPAPVTTPQPVQPQPGTSIPSPFVQSAGMIIPPAGIVMPQPVRIDQMNTQSVPSARTIRGG